MTQQTDEEIADKCIDIIRQEKRASTFLFQRRLRLGYTAATRIMDILEKRGIVGPLETEKECAPRKVLINLDEVQGSGT
jgi:S-DNA-T family DNA segregation ATPase FtsK/SpoIIIE